MSRSDTPASFAPRPVVGVGPSTSRVDWAHVFMQAAVASVFLVVLYWNVIRTLVYKWIHIGDWSHGFLIPVFSLYYLYQQRERMPTGPVRGGYGGLLILLGSYAVYLYSTAIVPFGYLQSLSLVVSVLGVVTLLGGWATTRWAWFAVAFLVFALPLPGATYEQVTQPLQRIATAISAKLLALLPEMEVEASNIIVIYNFRGRMGQLNVEQACSGIRLMMAFAALGVAMAFASERKLWHRMVMILSCVPIAVFCNLIRVTTTGLFVVFGREDLARGFAHQMIGLCTLPIAFALFGAISYVLGHLFVDAPEGAARTEPGGAAVVEESTS